jgi:hypothetical protein
VKKFLPFAALTVTVGAAFFFMGPGSPAGRPELSKHFVQTRGSRFVIAGQPFRFAGANVSVMYRDEDRARMPETLRQAA